MPLIVQALGWLASDGKSPGTQVAALSVLGQVGNWSSQGNSGLMPVKRRGATLK